MRQLPENFIKKLQQMSTKYWLPFSVLCGNPGEWVECNQAAPEICLCPVLFKTAYMEVKGVDIYGNNSNKAAKFNGY